MLTEEQKEEVAQAIFKQKMNWEMETAFGMETMLNMLVPHEEAEQVMRRVKELLVEEGGA